MSSVDFTVGFQPVFRDSNGLSNAVATLYEELWPLRKYDQNLHTGLVGALTALKANRMTAVGLASRSYGRLPLFCFIPPIQRDNVKSRAIRTAFEENLRSLEAQGGGKERLEVPFLVLQEGSLGEIWAILRRFKDKESVKLPSGQESFCAVFTRILPSVERRPLRAQWMQFCGQAAAPMFFDLFRHRERRMMPFAPMISQLYWDEAAGPPSQVRYHPPWDESITGDGRAAVRQTVTLSVDMRKSTFCMDQAESQPEFGRWLDRLVQVIIEVCHKHGGIFDKFTGDGGLMHFLDEECHATVGVAGIEAAFKCAVHLCSEVDRLLPSLRRNLRNNSGRLGAGISIAASEAFWSVDHRDNPIVVGHGVVDACRICDGTPPRTIRMSNLAHSRLSAVNFPAADMFHESDLGETKEWKGDMKLKVWEMSTG